MDIIGLQWASAYTITWAVDGGSTTPATSTTGANTSGKVLAQIRGLDPDVAHTIAVRCTSGSAFLEGALVYAGDESAGVNVIEAGYTGWKTTDWVSSVGTGAARMGLLLTYQPKVVVLALPVNDYAGGGSQTVTSAQSKANLKTIIAAVRAQYSNPGGSPTPDAYGPSIVISLPWQITTGSYTNTLTVLIPAGTTNNGSTSATAVGTVTNVVNLGVSKAVGSSTVAVGGTTSFTLVVSNAGPGTLSGSLSDTIPSQLTTTGARISSAVNGSASTASFGLSGSTFAGSVTIASGGTVTVTNTGGAIKAGGNGIEATARFRERYPQIAVLILSMHALQRMAA